jgi:Na+/H+ antiporter NhaD/arsenite permease-like protein
MKGTRFLTGAILLGLLLFPWGSTSGKEGATLIITGWVVDSQGVPLEGASIKIRVEDSQGVLIDDVGETTDSQADGSFLLILPSSIVDQAMEGQGQLTLEVRKVSYTTLSRTLSLEGAGRIGEQLYLSLGDLTLAHHTGAAFFIATLAFLLVFGFISFRVVHQTIAALMGAVAVLGVSYILGSSNPDFWILSFERAIHYIDFNVIFLIMGMMIFVAIVGRTGVFQWLGYQAYRATGGNAWYLAALLTIITAVASALLNNVIIMLLVAPVTIEMALVLGVHPFSLLIPEVLAANIGGAATLIGAPTNTLIGSYAGLDFLDFLFHMGPIVVLSMVALLVMIRFIYRKEYAKARKVSSPALLDRLREGAQITDAGTLWKALIMGGVTLVLFFVQDLLGMPPSVAALLGATGLLLWVRPDIEEMLQEVDWTTLVFFMGLFIVVGSIEEVGLIQMIAQFIGALSKGNLTLAAIFMLWVAGMASSIIDNIPLAAAALPIAAFLSTTIPGAENNVLYWALAVGACFGGNGTVIGSVPNIVTAGMADRAGYHLSFGHFLRVGLPTIFVTLSVAMIWILIRY